MKNEKFQNTNKEITMRFYESVVTLKKMGIIKSYVAFCEEFSINRYLFWSFKLGNNSGSIQLSWIASLNNRYNVSFEWIMTGK